MSTLTDKELRRLVDHSLNRLENIETEVRTIAGHMQKIDRELLNRGKKPTKPTPEPPPEPDPVPVPEPTPEPTPTPEPVPDPLPPPTSEGAAAILGPQAPMGTSPWPFFDRNQVERAQVHALTIMQAYTAGDTDSAMGADYYDYVLSQYSLHARTGATEHLQRARLVAEARWRMLPKLVAWEDWKSPYAMTPRNSSLGGLILYALDGGGSVAQNFEEGQPGHSSYRLVPMTLWEYVTGYARDQFQLWIGARQTYDGLYYGVRDGGYMQTYAAWLAQVHPDAAVRAEFREKAVTAAKDYYIRLQRADGGWYWADDGTETKPDGVHHQPFMVGLLLEGLIEVHQMTADTHVGAAILKSVDHIWTHYRKDEKVPDAAAGGAAWRAVPYFVFTDGTSAGESNLEGGWDTNTIREGRQRNSLVVHAFGYAYHITKDPKYREWGDEIFAATYGKGEGPAADPYYGLGDFRAKEYSQAYRSAGRYLAWRQ
jgi:hypothetical protein